MNGAGDTTLRQLQLQLHAKLRDSGSNRAEEKRFRLMTMEELQSLLHRKVLRTDLKTEAYDSSSRAGVVHEGALTEASSEILGDLMVESVDSSALSRSGPRSIKPEANGDRSGPDIATMAMANGGVFIVMGGVKKTTRTEDQAGVRKSLHDSSVFSRSGFRSTSPEMNEGISTTESENIDAKWLGLRDSGVNGSYLPRSGVEVRVSDRDGLDIRMIAADSCGLDRARVEVRGSIAENCESSRIGAVTRESSRFGAKTDRMIVGSMKSVNGFERFHEFNRDSNRIWHGSGIFERSEGLRGHGRNRTDQRQLYPTGHRQFELSPKPLTDEIERVKERTSMDALRAKIRVKVSLLSSITLGQIMDVAQMVGDENKQPKSPITPLLHDSPVSKPSYSPTSIALCNTARAGFRKSSQVEVMSRMRGAISDKNSGGIGPGSQHSSTIMVGTKYFSMIPNEFEADSGHYYASVKISSDPEANWHSFGKKLSKAELVAPSPRSACINMGRRWCHSNPIT